MNRKYFFISLFFLLIQLQLKVWANDETKYNSIYINKDFISKYLFGSDTSFAISSSSGSFSFCTGSSITLSVTTNMPGFPTGISYQWFNHAGNITNANSNSLIVNSADSYGVIIKRTGDADTTLPAISVVSVTIPTANFTFSPNSVCAGIPINFTDNSTGSIAAYTWNFNDPNSNSNNTASSNNPTHIFVGNAGTGTQNFTVGLTVTDNNGCNNSITSNVTIKQLPDAKLKGPNATTYNGLYYFRQCSSASSASLDFSDISTTSNSSYRIIWGDNTTDFNSPTFSGLSSHNYGIGTYNLLYITTGSNGCIDTSLYNVFIGSNPSVGLNNPGNSTICTGTSLTFPITGVSSNTPGTTYTVTFNDNSASVLFNHPPPLDITHNFLISSCGKNSPSYKNSFYATIQASNPCLTSAATVEPIYVSQKPVANFSVSPLDTICINSSITVNNSSSSYGYINIPDCINGNAVWSISPATGWSITSGTLGNDYNSNNPDSWLSGNSIVSIKFNSAGTYTLKLRVGNPNCGYDEISKTICVNPTPNSSFTVDNNTGCSTLTVNTTNTTNNPNCGNNIYLWTTTYTPTSNCTPNTSLVSFTNSTNVASQNPRLQFVNPGTYSLTLKTTSPGSCVSTSSPQTIIVKAKPTVSAINANNVCVNGSINPTVTVGNCNSSTTETYNWSFINASPNSSTNKTPTNIVYPTTGNQTISLDVTNECGTTTVTKSITVTPLPTIYNVTGGGSYCSGSVGVAIGLDNSQTGVNYQLQINGTNTGSPIAGTGTTINFGNKTAVGTYTVVATNATSSCTQTMNSNAVISINSLPSLIITNPIAVCSPSTIDLTASSVTTGSTTGITFSYWTNINATNILSTPNAVATSGTYYIKGTDGNGCSIIKPVSVTVNLMPSLTITNPAAVCSPSTVNLTSSSITTGSTSGLTYSYWIDANATTSLSSPNAVSISGTYYIKGTNSNNCSVIKPVVVVINSLPSVSISNPSAVCFPSTIDLTASSVTSGSSTGLTFSYWKNSNATTSLNSPNAVSTSGTYYIKGTNSTSCSAIQPVVVTVNPLPSANTGSNQTICSGNSVTIGTAAINGNTYSWSSNPIGFTSTSSNPIVNPITTTTYTLQESIPTTGCTNSNNVIISVNPAQNISNSSFSNPTTCSGTDGFITLNGLTASISYSVNYSFNNGAIQTKTILSDANGNLIIGGLVAGIYSSIKVTLNNCSSNIVGPFTLINPTAPIAPTVSDTAYCQNSTAAALTAIFIPGNTLKWYATAIGGTGNLAAPIPSTLVAGTFKYYVTQTSSEGCESIRSVINVTIYPTPTAPTVSNIAYCQNANSIALTANASVGNTLNWYTIASGGTANSTAPIPTTVNVGSTDYYVSQTTSFSCESPRAKITVIVNGIPDVYTQSDKIFCNGISTGNISFTGSLIGTTYNWTNDNTLIGLAASGTNTISFNATNNSTSPISGNIKITPTLNSCVGTPVSFIITINPSPTLNSLLANPAICSNTIFNYQATSATTNTKYYWSRNGTSGISNIAANSFDSSGFISETLINTTTNPVLVTYNFISKASGCATSQNVTVTINPDAKATYNFTKNNFCSPAILDKSNLIATPYSNTNSSYLWYANNILKGNNIIFPGYTINNQNDSVIIKLLTISKYGCKNDSIAYTFYTAATPIPSFSKSINKGCGPLTVNFTNTTTPLPLDQFSYKWIFGNGDSSLLKNPPAVTFKSRSDHRDTTYYITLTAFIQCDTITTLKDSVIVRSSPLAIFQPDTTVGCTLNTSPFLFTAKNISIGKPNTYYWDYGDNTKDTILTETSISHLYTVAQVSNFTIKLKAVNECGNNEDSIKIIVFPRNIDAKLFVDGPNTWNCAPDTVTFRNVSSGADKYVINFGDGSPDSIYVSTLSVENINHYYRNPGTYVVTMNASNGCSNSDTTLSITIYLYQKPSASFTTNKTTYCKKENIFFQNTSALGLSYEWFFGDGTSSNSYSPTHFYTQANAYNVMLVVKSINSPGVFCTDTLKQTIIIADVPVSNFTSNSILKNCTPFNFVGITNQPSGNIVNWHFMDNYSSDTTMFGNTGTHLFNIPGIYNIMLVVFNPQGCSDTSYNTINVIATPKASFIASDSIRCFNSDTIYFNNNSTYSEKDIVSYSWYINGILKSNSTNFKNKFSVSSTIINPVYYTVMLIATNSYGCSDTITKTITLIPNPIANFVVSPTQGCTPFAITFNNTSKYADIFKWYINGQLFSSLLSPSSYVLTQPSTIYNIKLVANQLLACGSDSINKQVITNAKPNCSFTTFNNTLPCTGILNVLFNDASTVANATIKNWYWFFGDGQNSNLQNTSHTYSTPGTYIVSHYVQDDNGCASDTLYKSLVDFGKPTIGFVLNNVCLGTPSTPFFTSFDFGYGSTKIKNYLWDFGDGNIDTAANPVHTYTKEGIYTVTLTTLSDSSCVSDTSTQIIKVFGKPIADFKYDISCVNSPIQFTDKSIAGFGQTSVGNYTWNFGDGSAITNILNPIHSFSAAKQYPVTLIVSSALCPKLTDSIIKSISITQPRASQKYPVINTSRGIPTQLSALSGGISYLWYPSTELNSYIIQNPIATYTVSNPSKIFYTISITDSSGCIVNDEQEVWLFSEPDVFVPTAFTPNGDGVNDIFLPIYVDISRIEYFRIFDRWGKQVFETSDMGRGWEGIYNGKAMPMDTYVYVIIAIDKRGNKLLRKGNVTLIRD